MLPISFPDPSFRIRQREVDGAEEIFDSIRKRWLLLTPEEWVRQNFIAYLVQRANVPSALIGVEKMVKVGELKRRFDIVVFDKNGQAWMLIECKSMEVPLSHKTIEQALSYISGMTCKYAVVTNGGASYGWDVANGCTLLDQFPEFN